MGITHSFVSSRSDGPDPDQIQPSHWNAPHTQDGVVRLLGPYPLAYDQADIPGVGEAFTVQAEDSPFEWPMTGTGTYSIFNGRVVTDAFFDGDGVTITSATANFTGADVGKPIGDGAVHVVNSPVPTIDSVTNSTTAVATGGLGDVGGPFALFIGNDSLTLNYSDDIPTVQAALDTLYGSGNAEAFIALDAFQDPNSPNKLDILFRFHQRTAFIMDNVTGTNMPLVYGQVAGNVTPRLGRTLFTPNVGDEILELFVDIIEPFTSVENGEIDLAFGDHLYDDPFSSGFPLTLRHTIGKTSGGGFIPVQSAGTIVADNRLNSFTLRTGVFYASSVSADYSDWWAGRGEVLRSVPFTVVLGAISTPQTITGGLLNVKVLVATPTTTY